MTNLDKYPNLQAILAGTVAGSFRDWIAVRPELEKLVAEVDKQEGLIETWGDITLNHLKTIQVIRKEAAFYKAEADSQSEINSKTHTHYQARIEELETVLKKVQSWGADARSADSYEVFEAVRVSLVDLTEPVKVKVADCTCVPCTCPTIGDERCLGCGSRMCMAHELQLDEIRKEATEAQNRVLKSGGEK